ncbi:MFS transporter [Streptomyces sp. RB17]|uniref:MFS transporter n=1 Tax=Streptomyces sp. RB17 TaxID=2585197 RepID=UPI001886535D|nr:MFS transporter [Streptomyces sp. RB17]
MAAFWGVGFTLGVFMFAASAPAPLYRVYAARWHFSALTLTAVFALYAVGLLIGLLVTGRLSDHLGRRPVILASITAEILAMICFILANSTALLCVARTVQGVATGCALGALSAALAELSESKGSLLGTVVVSSAPPFGLALGGLGSAALVYGPVPLRLVYWLIIAGLVVGAAAVAATRETVERRPGALASLKPVIGIPPEARSTFVAILPSLIALWALIGFYLSLGPGLAASIEGSPNLLWGGFAVFCMCFSGGTAVVLGRQAAAPKAMFIGCLALFAGVGLTFIAIVAGNIALFLTGSAIAGVGFGLAFLGNVRAVVQGAQPAQRAGALAVLYIVSYLMFSVPIVIAGIAEAHISAHEVALIFSGSVTLLAAVGIAASLTQRTRPTPVVQAASTRPEHSGAPTKAP